MPYVSHNNMSSSPFDLIHLDTWGPFLVESADGYRYFLMIVDDCTRVTWIYMMRNKSDVHYIFFAFIKYVQTQYQSVIKKLRSDNAPELAFSQLITYLGIVHQFSCAYTPQQYSVVEHKHLHLLNVAHALLFQSQVPLAYWSDCVLTAVFLINRTPSLLLNKRSPYEVLCKKVPDCDFLRTFGCLCYASTYPKDRTKFTPRASSCVFLGYASGYKGYKVLDLDTIKFLLPVMLHFKKLYSLLKLNLQVLVMILCLQNPFCLCLLLFLWIVVHLYLFILQSFHQIWFLILLNLVLSMDQGRLPYLLQDQFHFLTLDRDDKVRLQAILLTIIVLLLKFLLLLLLLLIHHPPQSPLILFLLLLTTVEISLS